MMKSWQLLTKPKDDEVVKNNLIQPLAVAGAKYYSIGTPGSGIYNFKYDDEGTVSIIQSSATVVAVAATIVSLFAENEPSKKASQIIAAAATLLALVVTSKTTFAWRYRHLNDDKNKYYYQDTVGLYYPAKVTSSNLKIHITHFYGFN